ncbi:MAG: hypothetical protein K2H32_04385 [Muribaculaceae bacterium]|nr:hypothetical protein [Muribaculaceae bacterium]MDE5857578.1 hypothetical protein [Muribaculaceae bacterium]
MFNVKTNFITLATACFATISFVSCKSDSTIAAEKLVENAQSFIADGNPAKAIQALDSLSALYPGEIEAGRRALALRPQAIEQLTITEIQTTDSLIAIYSIENQEYVNSIKKIDDKELLEPYYVAKSGYDPAFMNKTAIQPRVDNIGQFYILSSVNGSKLHHNSITIKSNAGEVSTETVPFDSDSNFDIDGAELVTYSPQSCDTIGYFIAQNPEATYTVVFNGENGKNISNKLSSEQVKGIIDSWKYSRSIVQGRDLSARKQMLEQRLQIARDQIARTKSE